MTEAPTPTPSALCNDLLNGLHGFQQGSVPAAEIERVVGIVRGRVADSRRDTFARIEEQGAAHEKTYAQQIDGLRAAFDLMARALDALQAHTREKTSFEEADSLLRQAGFAMQYASDWYLRSELEQGPTRMPIVNMLYKMRDGHQAGRVPEANYRACLAGATQQMTAAIAELEKAPPHTAVLKLAYERHKAALDKVSHDLTQALDEVASTGEAIRDALDQVNQAAMTAGPSRLPRTNVLLNHLDAHEKQETTNETLQAALKSFEEDLAEERQEVDHLSGMPSSAKITRLLAVTRGAYQLHDGAIALVREVVAGAPRHAEARQELLDAAETLADCREEFEALDAEGKVLCVRCSAPNPPGQRSCSKCHAQLPAAGLGGTASTLTVGEDGVAETDGEMEVTENIVKLFTAVNQVAEGKLSADEFGQVLGWLDGVLAEVELPPLPTFPGRERLAEEHRQQLADVELQCEAAREELSEGYQDFREALARMGCYLEDRDKDHLTVGVQAVRDAVVKIQSNTRRIEGLAEAAQTAGKSAEEG